MKIQNYFFILLLIISSCSQYPKEVENALKYAGDNREELEKVIAKYQKLEDSLKLKATYFLIENMPGKYHYRNDVADTKIDTLSKKLQELKKTNLNNDDINFDSLYNTYNFQYAHNQITEDIKVIPALMLIENIEMAFYVWENMPWSNHLTFEYFCDYVLPYKSLTSRPEFWRKKLYEKYKWVLDSIKNKNDPVEACILINNELKTWFKFNNRAGNKLPYSILQIYKHERGACEHANMLAVHAMRSIGIPVHVIKSVITGSPPNKGSHKESIVLTTDLKPLRFQGSLKNPNEKAGWIWWINEPRGKWYCQQYRKNKLWITELISDKNNVPPTLRNNNFLDITKKVTKTFNIKVKRNKTPTEYSNNNGYAYLCVSTRRGGWTAIDYAEIRNDSILFNDIEPNLIYFPLYYKDNNFHQCANPFMITPKGIIKPILPLALNSKNTQTVKLYRKYPIPDAGKEWADSLIGDSFQAANDSLFSNSVILHTITDTDPYLSIQDIPINDTRKYQFVRYVSCKIDSCFNDLAEMGFYEMNDTTEEKINGKLIYSKTINPKFEKQMKKSFDNNWLTFTQHIWTRDSVWYGLKLKQAARISRIKYISRNDLNSIVPGNLYELDYLDDSKWIPLETKIADNYFVTFDNVPVNVIFLLRNLTEGKEEYLFTYENDKQVWW